MCSINTRSDRRIATVWQLVLQNAASEAGCTTRFPITFSQVSTVTSTSPRPQRQLQALSLPVHPSLSEEDIETIIEGVNEG